MVESSSDCPSPNFPSPLPIWRPALPLSWSFDRPNGLVMSTFDGGGGEGIEGGEEGGNGPWGAYTRQMDALGLLALAITQYVGLKLFSPVIWNFNNMAAFFAAFWWGSCNSTAQPHLLGPSDWVGSAARDKIGATTDDVDRIGSSSLGFSLSPFNSAKKGST